jgi:mitochondrial ATPase complex subunit ATP10
MQRGYFDDFREFRDTKGKVFRATERLLPASHAPQFPSISVADSRGNEFTFPVDAATATATPAVRLIVAAFRAGAQNMVEAWATGFSKAFSNHAQAALVELALIEQPIMGLWPFRKAIMAAGTGSQDKYGMPAQYLYYFGGTDDIRAVLGMKNRLTGYAYLLDRAGAVRWRGSGAPDDAELNSMLQCSRQLLAEDMLER